MEPKFYLRNRAFSLLELMVAVGILSTGIIIILQALSFSARVTGLSCDITSAVFLAQDKIQELEFKERNNLIANEPQQASGTKDKFNWSYNLNLDAGLNLYKLNLEIIWQRPDREEKLSLSTYLK